MKQVHVYEVQIWDVQNFSFKGFDMAQGVVFYTGSRNSACYCNMPLVD